MFRYVCIVVIVSFLISCTKQGEVKKVNCTQEKITRVKKLIESGKMDSLLVTDISVKCLDSALFENKTALLYSIGAYYSFHYLKNEKQYMDSIYSEKNNIFNVVKALVDFGVDVNKVSTSLDCHKLDSVLKTNEYYDITSFKCHKMLPMFGAVQTNNEKVVSLLLDNGVDANIIPTSPNLRYIGFADSAVAEVLLKHGAKMSPDYIGYNLLKDAILRRNCGLAKVFINNGFDTAGVRKVIDQPVDVMYKRESKCDDLFD